MCASNSVGAAGLPMPLMHWIPVVLKSLAILVLATFALVGLNIAGGTLWQWLDPPAGSELRLAWDLGWWAASVMLAFWVIARWIPVAPRRFVLVALLAMMALLLWAAFDMWGQFPHWFVGGGLLSPLLGAWFAMRWVRRRSSAASLRVAQDR